MSPPSYLAFFLSNLSFFFFLSSWVSKTQPNHWTNLPAWNCSVWGLLDRGTGTRPYYLVNHDDKKIEGPFGEKSRT